MNSASNYPVGMSECYRIGLSGGCGEDCPVYLRGECEVDNEEKIAENRKNMSATKHLEVD